MEKVIISRFEYRRACLSGAYRKAYKRLFKKEAPYRKINGKRVISDPEQSNELLFEMIVSGRPFMVGRFGSVENSVIGAYYRKTLFRDDYSEKEMFALCNNAGFFPRDVSLIDRFALLMLDCCKELDVVGLWNDFFEMHTVKQFAKNAQGVKLFCLEPYYHIENSWTHALNGKKVLVVHPFKATIDRQKGSLKELFDSRFWPDCAIITYRSVQTIGETIDPRFNNWFQALEHMEKEISGLDFDIAIIGCGAYGFPLAAFVKSLGKQAIHLGGATQLLFGIKGKRWDDSPLSGFFNESWTRPIPNDCNDNAKFVEGGCYW